MNFSDPVVTAPLLAVGGFSFAALSVRAFRAGRRWEGVLLAGIGAAWCAAVASLL